MAQATIDTEVALQCVTAITQSMDKITEACLQHQEVLTDLAEKTNIDPIISMEKAFNAMNMACKRAAEGLDECLIKTTKYCDEANEINSNDEGLFMD